MEGLLLSSNIGNDDTELLAKKVATHIGLFAKAFDANILNCQRVLEITVLPFLKLALKCQLGSDGFPQLRSMAADMLFASWANGVKNPLCWHSKIGSGQYGFRPSMQSSKREELAKAMMAAKIHEVGNQKCRLEYKKRVYPKKLLFI